MNENNQAISSYDYDAWGNPMNSTVSEISAYRYTGREHDDETGLHNFRARLYDSTLMRFYQVDPAEQFASPYVYCGNNPIGLVDPDGERVRFQGNDDDVQYTMSNLSLGDYQISMDNDGYLHVPNDIDRTQLTEQDNMIVDFILDTSGTTVLDFSSSGFTNGLLCNTQPIFGGLLAGKTSRNTHTTHIHRLGLQALATLTRTEYADKIKHEINENGYYRTHYPTDRYQQDKYEIAHNWANNLQGALGSFDVYQREFVPYSLRNSEITVFTKPGTYSNQDGDVLGAFGAYRWVGPNGKSQTIFLRRVR